MPGDDVLGQATGDELVIPNAQAQDRYWVWVNGTCWSRWVFVGYNWWGQATYRRYVYCR
jgi:hypothetical protein